MVDNQSIKKNNILQSDSWVPTAFLSTLAVGFLAFGGKSLYSELQKEGKRDFSMTIGCALAAVVFCIAIFLVNWIKKEDGKFPANKVSDVSVNEVSSSNEKGN